MIVLKIGMLCFNSILQSCQPTGFKVKVMFVNQYYAKLHLNLEHKTLTEKRHKLLIFCDILLTRFICNLHFLTQVFAIAGDSDSQIDLNSVVWFFSEIIASSAPRSISG